MAEPPDDYTDEQLLELAAEFGHFERLRGKKLPPGSAERIAGAALRAFDRGYAADRPPPTSPKSF